VDIFHHMRVAGIEYILDIGPLVDIPACIGNIPVKRLGLLPSDLLSELLSDIRIGLLDYPSARLTKSSIAAAYFAHGVLCVRISGKSEGVGQIAEGREYAALSDLSSSSTNLQSIATSGHRWYSHHNRSNTAEMLLKLIT